MAATLLKEIVPGVEPKPLPLTVTGVPTDPALGDTAFTKRFETVKVGLEDSINVNSRHNRPFAPALDFFKGSFAKPPYFDSVCGFNRF